MEYDKQWIATISAMLAAFIVQFLGEPLAAAGFSISESHLQATFVLPIVGIIIKYFNDKHKREIDLKHKIAGVDTESKEPDLYEPEIFDATKVAAGSDEPTFPSSIQSESKVSPTSTQYVTKPKLGPKGAPYQTNFHQTTQGNSLSYGEEYLWIERLGARSYVDVEIFDSNKKLLEIAQSSQHDEDNNVATTRLKMKDRNGKFLPRGKYYVTSQGDSGTSDSTGAKLDEFWIV